MMEYPTWRKKSNTQQFINFMKSHRLDLPPLEETEQISRQVRELMIFLFDVQPVYQVTLDEIIERRTLPILLSETAS